MKNTAAQRELSVSPCRYKTSAKSTISTIITALTTEGAQPVKTAYNAAKTIAAAADFLLPKIRLKISLTAKHIAAVCSPETASTWLIPAEE